jgi:UDP-N-acetylmuramate--alanine ligase
MGVLRYHFSGIAGAGVNPLARLVRARGHQAQGSDRSFDQGKNAEVAEELRRLGVTVVPQDGAAVTSSVDRFVYSTAVEEDTPEMRAARAAGVPCVPRPALLAEIVNTGMPGIAISGTSGKSTITGMVAWLAREAGLSATVIGGAALVGDRGGLLVSGPATGPVAAEACESDGTLVGYRPSIGIIHNISRDHAELPSLRAQFTKFARQCRRLFVNAACPEAAALGRPLGAVPYRVDHAGVVRLPMRSLTLTVPQPGHHNLENAAAAALAALAIGVDAGTVQELLARFPGVARRFEVVGTTSRGIRVIDDYAHNGAKIAAAIAAAQAGAERVVAVFQPHGFGPARFLRAELCELLPRSLRPRDRFCYSEIFYAGGTISRDISSRDLVGDVPASLCCGYAADHAGVVEWVRSEARPGDTVLLMGARDPELPGLARAVYAALA